MTASASAYSVRIVAALKGPNGRPIRALYVVAPAGSDPSDIEGEGKSVVIADYPLKLNAEGLPMGYRWECSVPHLHRYWEDVYEPMVDRTA